MSHFGVNWCLQQVDYDHIDFSKRFTRTGPSTHGASSFKSSPGEVPTSPTHEDSGFLDGSFSFSSDVLDDDAISRLRDSILDPTKHADIPHILSTWPRHHLRLKDAITAEELHWSIPDVDVLWKMMFQSLVSRQPECQLEVLDLTEFQPSSGLLHLIMQILPILYLPDEHRNSEYIRKTITTELNLEDPALIERLRVHVTTVLTHRVFYGGHPIKHSDTSLTVLLDEMPVNEDHLLFLSMLMATGLQKDTCLYVLPRSVISRGEWTKQTADGEQIKHNELLLLQQKHMSQALEGMILTAPEFKAVQATNYINLSNLSLANLNKSSPNINNNNNGEENGFISDLTKGLSQLIHLQRLELKDSNLVGCFREILNSMQRPLEYLSISGSLMSPSDINAFKTWKFASMLKDLNASSLYPVEEGNKNVDLNSMDLSRTEVSSKDITYSNGTKESRGQNAKSNNLIASLVDAVQYLPFLVVLDVHGNQMSKDAFTGLGDAVAEHLKELKMLRFHDVQALKRENDLISFPDDEDIMRLVTQFKDHLAFQILYVTRLCRCMNNETCSTECKIAFWSKLDDIVGSIPVKVCVQMK